MVDGKIGKVLIGKSLVSAGKLEMALSLQEKKKKAGEYFLLGEILSDQLNLIKPEVINGAMKEVLGDVKPGGEFLLIENLIKGIVGESAYAEAKNIQKNNQQLNLFEIIGKNFDYLSTKTQKRLFVNLMKPYVSNAIVGYPEKITTRSIGGKQTFFYDGKPVVLDWYPKIGVTSQQVILTKSELDQKNSLKQEAEGNAHESKGTYGDVPYSVHKIVEDACSQEASDIHIIPKETDYFVFFRIHGELVIQTKYMLTLERGRSLVYTIKNLAAGSTFTGTFIAEDKREIKDARAELAETCGGVDLRIVVIPTYDGGIQDEELVCRIIKKIGFEKKTLHEQGYFPEDAQKIEKAFLRRGGLFLTSGKTNSGKTTFNAQLLMTDTTRKWETIEDPKEYSMTNKNICQHQTYRPKEGTKVGFTELVTAFKRADPDGILIGEIRQDKELIEAVIEASKAGQMVLGTIHINNIFEIYDALKDAFGVDYYTAARLILYAHNQALVKRLCDNCKVIDKDKANYNALNIIKDELPYIVISELQSYLENPFKTYIASGKTSDGKVCEHCNGTGYSGRTPIYAYFYPTPTFMKWVMDNKPDFYAIEEKVCTGNEAIGVNKLQIFLKKLKAGQIDANPHSIRELM